MRFILILFILFTPFLYAQESDSLHFIVNHNPVNTTAYPATTGGLILNETNDITLFFSLLQKIYQTFISSQDIPSCNFYPTCSSYAVQAVKKYTPLLGVIMAADRLLRCNGQDLHYYPRHEESGRRYDPVW